MRYFWCLLLLTACHGVRVDHETILMADTLPSDAVSEQTIAPYRDSLSQTMETVLIENAKPLTRSIPESLLGNLIADLLLERAQLDMPDSLLPDLCLINIGGLRVDLPAGPITIGKVFELMPFENEMDIIRLSPEKMSEMIDHLKDKGGQPIAGMRLLIDPAGIVCEVAGEPLDPTRSYQVVTSDYLADGGDHMGFFENPEGRIHTGIKIRDAIIDHFRVLGLAGKPLTSELDGRLTIN